MKIIEITCDNCGKTIYRQPCHVKPHNFCSRKCLGEARHKKTLGIDTRKSSEHMRNLNKKMNPTRMTDEVRKKLRDAHLGMGAGLSYAKLYGKPEHRVVAELTLGRRLLPTEVVHHLDEDKRNNTPQNLVVFVSQAEHAKFHKEGGDAHDFRATCLSDLCDPENTRPE